jgi:broad specificity phosphatase PhoE
MIALYLSHPQVTVDPTTPVPLWSLSPQGRARLQALPWTARLTAIFSSPETKALQTAALLRPDLAPHIDPDLAENHRAAFLPPPAFEAAADAFFAQPDHPPQGWESARAAQTRIRTAFDRLTQGVTTPILFSGHGAVGTLLHQSLSQTPISRQGDQPQGGGNLFAIDLATRRPLTPWTPLESWTSPV